MKQLSLTWWVALVIGLWPAFNFANAAQFKVTFSAGHGTQLPWVRMIKEFYIPEVDKRLAAGGQHSIVWTEAFGGTLA